MTTKKSRDLVLTLMVCLAAIQFTAYARDEDLISMSMTSGLTIPFIESAPKIDGQIDIGQWKSTSACTGFYDYKNIPTIMDNGPIVFMCYNDTSIYLLTLCPQEEGRPLKAKCTNRDDNVYTDDSVEVFFFTPKKHLFQFVVNSLGTLADLKDNDVQWNGNIRASASHILGRELPKEYGLRGRYWVAEFEIPFNELDVARIKPGDRWTMNIGINRAEPWASLAALSSTAYAETKAFVPITFLAPDEPFVQFTSLGNAQYGRVHIRGRVVNPGAGAVELKVSFDLWKHGSYLTDDAYQDIVGVIVPATKKLPLKPKSEALLNIKKVVTNTAIDRMALRVFQVADTEKTLLERPGFVKIRPQFNVAIGNVPPKKYLVLKIDPIGLKNELSSALVTVPEKSDSWSEFTARDDASKLGWSALPEGNPNLRIIENAAVGKSALEVRGWAGRTNGGLRLARNFNLKPYKSGDTLRFYIRGEAHSSYGPGKGGIVVRARFGKKSVWRALYTFSSEPREWKEFEIDMNLDNISQDHWKTWRKDKQSDVFTNDDWTNLTSIEWESYYCYYEPDFIQVDGVAFQQLPKMDIVAEAIDKNGKTALTKKISDALKDDELIFDYSALPVGEYTCRVTPVIEGGKKIQSYESSFRHPAKPDWWNNEYDRYARTDRILKPWTPIEYGEKSISVWGRTMKWQDSILPSSITTQGKELLVKPMRLVVVLGGKKHFIGLDNFKFTSKKQGRTEMVAEGLVDGLKVRAQMWFEYDGFGWITLNLSDSKNRKIEKLWIEVPMEPKYITLYQGYAKDAFGFVKNEPILWKWRYSPDSLQLNFYHWCGNEDLGLGFTYRTLEQWYPKSTDNFCTLIPGEKETTYKMNLIERPVEVDGFKYEFGIQATPIKPLPPDWHVMLATSFYNNFMNVPYRAQEKIPEQIDILLNWQPNVDMKGLNNPLEINMDKMNEIIRYAHAKGIAVSGPATCPQKISPVMKDYEDYVMAWKNIPESLLNWDKIAHLQNCGGSEAYRRWLFSTWAKFIKTYDIDGIYFDGWPAGQMGCYSRHHDNCGWVDADGKRHLTVAVLEGREFFKALALYLEDNIKSRYIPPKTAVKREGFPNYHLWIHSWSWVPPAIGFATIWFTGEFAAYPIKPNVAGMKTAEGSMAEAVGMDLFRTRCLSTNWGVPNLFDTITVSYRQTEMMMAWLLPHGSQVGAIDFMSGGPQLVSTIYDVFEKFGTRTAKFTPCWQKNPHVQIVGPVRDDVVVATWDHSANKVLAVVSNLQGKRKAAVTLKCKCIQRARVKDPIKNKSVPIQNGNEIKLELGPESYQFLWIDNVSETN